MAALSVVFVTLARCGRHELVNGAEIVDNVDPGHTISVQVLYCKIEYGLRERDRSTMQNQVLIDRSMEPMFCSAKPVVPRNHDSGFPRVQHKMSEIIQLVKDCSSALI